MASLLIAVIYLAFISLGLPDSLLGSAWPTMQTVFHVPSSYAGYVSMMISFMTIISALAGPGLIKRFQTKWIVIVSIFLTVIGLLGFSFMPMVFGKLQQAVGIWIMPLYLTLFAFLNIAFLEFAYQKIRRKGGENHA